MATFRTGAPTDFTRSLRQLADSGMMISAQIAKLTCDAGAGNSVTITTGLKQIVGNVMHCINTPIVPGVLYSGCSVTPNTTTDGSVDIAFDATASGVVYVAVLALGEPQYTA